MDLDRIHQKIVEIARKEPADERVPYAFEKRVMAQIRGRTPAFRYDGWAQLWWRAAFISLIVSLGLSLLSTVMARQPELSLSDYLETAVYAPIQETASNW